MTYIKPIETEFNGYRFRSRLEARWAVFFSTLEIPYEYEIEGFELGKDRIRYLPDFYMPTWKKFVEIKPSIQFDMEDFQKWGLLVQATEIPLLIIIGEPWPGRYNILPMIPAYTQRDKDKCFCGMGPTQDMIYFFAYGLDNGTLYLGKVNRDNLREAKELSIKNLVPLTLDWHMYDGTWLWIIETGNLEKNNLPLFENIHAVIGHVFELNDESRLSTAYQFAMQARFGRKGRG